MQLAPAWDRWRAIADVNHPAPGPDFWAFVNKLRLARKDTIKTRTRRLESVKELKSLSTPVGDEQICKMYGWIDAEGQPEYWKIAEEIEKPGKWSYDLYPDRWMPPHEKARAAEIQRQFEAAERQRLDRQARIEAATRVAKETYQELSAQPGITLTQIARMKRVTIDEAAEEIQKIGLPLPPLRMDLNSIQAPSDLREPDRPPAPPSPSLLPPGSLVDEKWEENPPLSDADLAEQAAIVQAASTSIEEQIRTLAGQGYTNREIAAMVSTPEKQVNVQYVSTVVIGPKSAGGPGLATAPLAAQGQPGMA